MKLLFVLLACVALATAAPRLAKVQSLVQQLEDDVRALEEPWRGDAFPPDYAHFNFNWHQFQTLLSDGENYRLAEVTIHNAIVETMRVPRWAQRVFGFNREENVHHAANFLRFTSGEKNYVMSLHYGGMQDVPAFVSMFAVYRAGASAPNQVDGVASEIADRMPMKLLNLNMRDDYELGQACVGNGMTFAEAVTAINGLMAGDWRVFHRARHDCQGFSVAAYNALRSRNQDHQCDAAATKDRLGRAAWRTQENMAWIGSTAQGIGNTVLVYASWIIAQVGSLFSTCRECLMGAEAGDEALIQEVASAVADEDGNDQLVDAGHDRGALREEVNLLREIPGPTDPGAQADGNDRIDNQAPDRCVYTRFPVTGSDVARAEAADQRGHGVDGDLPIHEVGVCSNVRHSNDHVLGVAYRYYVGEP